MEENGNLAKGLINNLDEVIKLLKRNKDSKQVQDFLKNLSKESLLKRSDVIQKIGVYCYEVEIERYEVEGNYYDTETENLIVIGINKDELEERTEGGYDSDEEKDYTYNLEGEYLFDKDEVIERFGLSEEDIASILEGENLELEDWRLEDTDYYSDCKLSIEELREKRAVDSEPFDFDDIISKITSECVLTPKRKKDLIKSIQGLK